MSDLTAEEFVRNKIREQRQINGEMRALWTYKVSGEDALRWAHEFALLKANYVNSNAVFDVKHSDCCKNCVHMSKNLKAQFKHEKWHCIETAYYITDPKNHTCEHHSREHLL